MREWQAYIMWLGYLCGCLLVIYQAEEGMNRAGGFVTFTAFWAQLSGQYIFVVLEYHLFKISTYSIFWLNVQRFFR
jgi:hypothetical protein